MKGVLFILTICSFVGVVLTKGFDNHRLPKCYGTGCIANCTEDECGTFCEGAGCAQNCDAKECGKYCIGNSCANGCKGDTCGASCVGKNCAANCQGDFCGLNCYHFKDEVCTDNLVTTVKMGIECSADDEPLKICETKNHPAVWQALKDTETNDDPITLPTGDIKQCFYNGTACVDTVDNFPPLVCNRLSFCQGTNNEKILENAKCTDTEKCGVCQGICENDSECKGDLKCFPRAGTETVPGCSSSSSGPRLDVPGKGYCADMPDSSTLNDGEIAAIAIGVPALLALCALAWCYRTKRGFFGTLGGMAEPIKL